MSFRFLATGDIHAKNYTQFARTRKDGMNSRLYNCVKVFDILLEEAKRRSINKILINGDTFHDANYIDTEIYDAVYLRLEKLHSAGMELVLNLGQHDVARESPRRILHTLRAFRKIATVVEKPTLVWDSVQVVPWIGSPSALKHTVKSLHADQKRCLVLHCGVRGARAGPNDFIVPNTLSLRDIRSHEFGLVLLSDYHTRQRLAKNVWYLGSPLQHSFGEIHRPCIWEISVGRGSVPFRLAKIFTPFPQFKRISIRTPDQLERQAHSLLGNYVEITIDVSQDARPFERIAQRLGLRHTIEQRETKEEVAQQTKTFDINKVMSRYVKSRSKNNTNRKRLIRLGQKLFEGGPIT